MRKTLLIIAFLLVSTGAVYAQSPDPTPPKVLVDQSFVDSAAKAFALVVELRDALQKEQMANGASAVTKAALQAQITALNELIAIKDRKETVYQSLLDLRDQAFAVYERIMKIQADMIDRLVAQINKPKTAWKKFVEGLATIGKIVLGAAIGRAF